MKILFIAIVFLIGSSAI